MVSPDQPEVSINGATVDFGLCNLPGEAKLTVKKLAPKQDAKNGFSIQPYDFSLEGRSEFHVPVLLEMAYAPSVEDDAAESNGISSSTTTAENGSWWQAGSTPTRTVTFWTNTLSTFGCLEIRAPGRRRVAVSSIRGLPRPDDACIHDGTPSTAACVCGREIFSIYRHPRFRGPTRPRACGCAQPVDMGRDLFPPRRRSYESLSRRLARGACVCVLQ